MENSGGFEVHCCSFFVEIRTLHGLVFQDGRGRWLLGSLGVNVGLSGLPGMRCEALRCRMLLRFLDEI
jgi:hypothetical protein